jgi:AcrR family transcriptional regulator
VTDTAPGAVTTRDRLLDEAERLFARGGFQGVTSREITEAAEQRNASAVTYHFGTREGLLLEILRRRGGPVDEARGERRATLGDAPPTDALVRCLVAPYADLLHHEEGRSYVRIVAQLRGRFAAWRVASDAATTRHLAGILDELESRPDASPAVRRERVVGLIMLLTGTVAERARRIDDGVGNELAHDEFVDNLVAMCTALLAG